MALVDFQTFVALLPIVIPASLTCLTCPYLFIKYFLQKEKNMGFTMIFLLTLSDFIFSLAALSSSVYPYLPFGRLYRFSLCMGMYFSILWASAIAFLIYKSLQLGNFSSKKTFFKTLALVIVLSLLFTGM